MSTPIAHLSRRYHFSASHRLHVDALSPEQNIATFGKCNNPFGHGHNYVVEVAFSGPVDPATGMVTNLADLDSFAQRNLLDLFDHANLNTLPLFLDQVSTTENLAVEVWRIFAEYPHATLRRVHIEETGNNSFDYFGNESAAVPAFM
ncbi:6-pyruvoyl tetrahydrobiopterin synthase [Granulicella sp. 5B5]|uniref:6-carboxytetrahydropterin synthase n=1 Tax=Granulicella sp. 5B5 TaxID=1617967 RepID=UPI0015F45227|nr:6-carboxytetrahydropterin synthase [Granulicella sp. 5B5]QMV19877.1 6-pyruvoyl tetrahydrobiopterin synthase [Granulicella sp. 5B5]